MGRRTETWKRKGRTKTKSHQRERGDVIVDGVEYSLKKSCIPTNQVTSQDKSNQFLLHNIKKLTQN